MRSLLLTFLLTVLAACCCASAAPRQAQMEMIGGAPPAYLWQSEARIQGHLALASSPDGAFSPDGSTLAVVEKYRVVLVGLAGGRVRKVLRPHIPGVSNLEIQSANFVSPSNVFLLATGLVRKKGRGKTAGTPELAFQWNVAEDTLSGKVDAVRVSGDVPARYFPQIRYLGIYSHSTFDLWSPLAGRAGAVTVPQLTHPPQLFTFSPDGHWLLLAQIETNSSPDPVVVLLRQHKFLTALEGHRGPVLGMAFSRDSKYVVTACADEQVRVFAVEGWKLIETLSGNRGPVHWAEFSPHANSVASAGEDTMVRIWSVAGGKLLQSLSESREPLLTVGFSPNGQFLAATSSDNVYIWRRTAAGN